jgi:hypothetical protein
VVDLDALISEAKLAERSVALCLRGDLTAQLQELERQLQEAEATRQASGALSGGARSRELAEQIEALRAQMLEHTLTLTLRAVPRRRWTALIAEHPPRANDELDQQLRVNVDTFFAVAVRECTVDPAMTTAQWDKLDEKLSDAQWHTLTAACWAINARDVEVPFSRLASRLTQDSESE